MMHKDKNTTMALVLEVLRGNSSQTTAEIAEETGYSVGAINAFRKEAKGILEAEGVEVPASKRGRKAGSTVASAPKAPRVQHELPAAQQIDMEALKAKMRAEIEAEILAKRPLSVQDLVEDLREVETEIKVLIERKATLLRQIDELQADTAKQVELIKNTSVLKKNDKKQAAE